jgi:hypothetical protein
MYIDVRIDDWKSTVTSPERQLPPNASFPRTLASSERHLPTNDGVIDGMRAFGFEKGGAHTVFGAWISVRTEAMYMAKPLDIAMYKLESSLSLLCGSL